MRDGISFRQLAATTLAGMAVPLTLLGARLHWRWVLLSLLCSLIYYYIMYKLQTERPLAEQIRAVFGRTGNVILWLTVMWLVLVSGFLSGKSALAFPQTADRSLTGLLLLGIAVWAAENGIRAVVRGGAILLPFLALMYAIVLIFSAPKIRTENLAPSGSLLQAAELLPLLLLPTVSLYFRPDDNDGRTTPWLLAGAAVTLAASVVTAGCLSSDIAARQMSFYQLAQSVSLFGAMERFEALVSAACLTGYFCLTALCLSTAKEILAWLLPEVRIRAWYLLLPAGLMLFAKRIPTTAVLYSGAIFCVIFPLIALLLGDRKKV